MTLSAVIVDDEQLARDELAYLLKGVDDINVVAQGKNGLEAVNLIREHNPDLVFLDVQMPGLDGFGVIKKLLDRKVPLPKIVFATAFDQYAVKAFEVNAVDYLLKPFDRKRVMQTIEKAQTRRSAQSESPSGPQKAAAATDAAAKLDALLKLVEEQAQAPTARVTTTSKVVVRAQSRLLLVDQKEICFAAIEEGTISVVTPTVEGHSNCRTLEELQSQLEPEMFWRAHRSYLVNIQHIREVVPWFKSSYQLRMDDPKKTEIPVSRAQTKRLRELFNL
jgi:two-component system LytT family response regulator/two-component system response regulator LytT